MSMDLNSLKEHYLRCVRCGQCRAVCPVFAGIGNETAAPRGKVFLAHMLAAGELKADAEIAHNLSLCLLCRACARECPSAVPVHKIITAARYQLAREVPNTLQKIIFKEIWSRPSLLNISSRLLRGCQNLGLTVLGRTMGMLPPALDLAGKLPRRPARSFIKEVTRPEGAPRIKVGYFLGCATNLLFPHVARSTVAVLSLLGCEVITPLELKCCGLPQEENGQMDVAESLARSNFAAFQRLGSKVIVTDCASCFAALKDSSAFKDIEIMDLFQLLNELLPGHNLKKIDQAITYHDPCHLAKAQGITAAPRELLTRICPGFREMPGANSCCGGGGSFMLYHYNTSMGILDKKISAIKETGAKIVTTSCPSCTMQIRHGLAKQGLPIPVIHPVELLAQTMGIIF